VTPPGLSTSIDSAPALAVTPVIEGGRSVPSHWTPSAAETPAALALKTTVAVPVGAALTRGSCAFTPTGDNAASHSQRWASREYRPPYTTPLVIWATAKAPPIPSAARSSAMALLGCATGAGALQPPDPVNRSERLNRTPSVFVVQATSTSSRANTTLGVSTDNTWGAVQSVIGLDQVPAGIESVASCTRHIAVPSMAVHAAIALPERSTARSASGTERSALASVCGALHCALAAVY
jgi:hypothetical protein